MCRSDFRAPPENQEWTADYADYADYADGKGFGLASQNALSALEAKMAHGSEIVGVCRDAGVLPKVFFYRKGRGGSRRGTQRRAMSFLIREIRGIRGQKLLQFLGMLNYRLRVVSWRSQNIHSAVTPTSPCNERDR